MDWFTDMKCAFTIDHELYAQLQAHLFPGDGDEHGAVIAAGISQDEGEVRFLARELILAVEGKDYLPSKVGHRCLSATFVAQTIEYCATRNLCYFAVHCHPGTNSVGFSAIDIDSHERGYPALLDISHGGPVGALVFARDAVAGDIWFSSSHRLQLAHVTVVGPQIHRLYPKPRRIPKAPAFHDRHVRLFGDLGQSILGGLKVGIIGLGGGGSLISEWISRLGVGEIIAIDDQRIESTNVPRVVGSTLLDSMSWLSDSKVPVLANFGRRMSRTKVSIAKRVAKKANSRIKYRAVRGSVLDEKVATTLKNCDFVFLATDNIQSRLVFNALVNQYLIPGAQIGIKINPDRDSKQIESILLNTRIVMPYPGGGCLECHELIPASMLQEESLTPEARRRQRYIDIDEVPEPSVITLNVLSAAQATNDLMMLFTGLYSDGVNLFHLQGEATRREWFTISSTVRPTCPDCSSHPKSRRAMGDRVRLPCKQK